MDTLTKGLYADGMASTLTLSRLLVFGYRQRIKKNKVECEKQEEIYKQEIAHKKKELASQTLHLVQKNTFIQILSFFRFGPSGIRNQHFCKGNLLKNYGI